jgi:hypothetical protein
MKSLLGIQLVRSFALSAHRLTFRLLRKSHPEWDSRTWSNQELRRFAPLFKGDILNVSGWKDEDKEGSRYADYFPGKSSYAVSNIPGARGLSGLTDEIFLDLQQDLPPLYNKKYDVVLSHTVLEHVFDTKTAVRNLCGLSKNIVIGVVPFVQVEHFEEDSYLDYWRFTRFGIRKLFQNEGFEVIYISANYNPVHPIYYFFIASCQPHTWESNLESPMKLDYSTHGRKLNPIDPEIMFMR